MAGSKARSAPLPPEPPVDLDTRQPRILTVPVGTTIHRFFDKSFDPIFYAKGSEGRLNSPDGSYGVLYSAKMPNGAFAETFLRTLGRRMLDPLLVSSRGIVHLEVLSDLHLIQFDGPGLAILGATAEIVHCGGPPYPNSQSWSRALHGHPVTADGIAYSSRHDPHQLCYAVFDRAAGSLSESSRELDLDVTWFWEIADAYDMGLPPS